MSKNSSLEDTAVGYNDTKCKEIDVGIEECYQEIVTIIKEAIEQEIVTPMSKAWYAEDAVEYMKEFRANTIRISDDIQKIFQNFRDQMQSDIDNWNTQTKNPSGTQLQDVSEKTVDIDVSAMQPVDGEGNRYISNTIATDVVTWVANCLKVVNDRGTQVIADHSIGSYIGEKQNDAANAALQAVLLAVEGVLVYLIVGENAIAVVTAGKQQEYIATAQRNTEETTNRDYAAGADVTGGADDN